MAGKFDIGRFADTLKTDVPKLDTTGREQIQYISIDLIDDDPNNFYELSCIDELAANIELCGLQQPIRVRAGEGGRYTIVSGHRRRAALRKLVEDGRAEYQEAPCIVEQTEGASAAMQELRLIYANADTRHLTSAEQSKQAQRVEALLYQLKEEGVEFPGRMRDHVAEACKLSKSKLARLKVIREKLIPLWAALYKKNQIAEDMAYELARLGEDYQIKLYQLRDGQYGVYANTINEYAKKLEALDAIKCPNGADCCSNAENMWARLLKRDYVTKNCNESYGSKAKCCKGCPELLKCKYACSAFADEIAAGKAKQKEKRRIEKTVEQEIKDAQLQAAQASWARFKYARTRVKMKTLYVLKSLFSDDPSRSHLCQSWNVSKWEERQDPANKTNTVQLADDLDQRDIVRLAELLQCSTDYLMGRVDEPQPFSGAWKSAHEEQPDEGRFLFVCDAFGCVQPSVFWNGDYMDSTLKSTANYTLQHIHYWMYQPALPGGMKHQGQATLEQIMRDRGLDNADT